MERRGDKVLVLRPEVAAMIAAGEVVDRPAALVRELVDNAIDAGAGAVEVAVEGGGAGRVEVVDDGRGMEKADLELCWLPHATSKISEADDLLSVETLGFRGEALSSISAVARLEIITSRDGRDAWRLNVGPGASPVSVPRVEAYRRAKGTTVRVEGLFDAYPARKKFLKRDGAEAALCRQALVDKALAFPELSFRYHSDGELKLFLPAVSTLKERFAQVFLDDAETVFLHEIAAAGEGFSLAIVVGGPELRRRDRRGEYVFANGRRIDDYGLQQALEYGVQGWFPNDAKPIGAVYVDVDPALADFNIHPAKREARFKDPRALHSAATAALKDFMRRLGVRDSERAAADLAGEALGAQAPALFEAPPLPRLPGPAAAAAYGDRAPSWTPGAAERTAAWPKPAETSGRGAMEALLEEAPAFAKPPREQRPSGAENGAGAAPAAEGRARYLGTAFGLFLVAEKGDRLYLIDQHAAHERIIYDRLRSAPARSQDLLIPLPFRADDAAGDAFLEKRRDELAKLGLVIERDGADGWQLSALPVSWGAADGKAVRDLLDLGKTGADLAERFFATSACRAAAKDGDVLDGRTAAGLAEAALDLPVPRCPHGRPVWMEISLRDALRAVRRVE